MAQNSASQNPSEYNDSFPVSQKLMHVTRTAGEPTAPLTSAPPQVDEQTRTQIADAAAKDAQGQHQGGDAAPKVKTEKECMLQPG
jgi:valyl-tRNA synthetase